MSKLSGDAITRRMLSNARDYQRGLIAEMNAPVSTLNEDLGNFNNADFQEEKTAFQQAVPCRVEFGNYVSDQRKVELRGVLKFSSGVKFLFTSERADGIFISMEDNNKPLQLDEQVVDAIAKLRAYYDLWYQKTVEKLNG